MVTLAPLQKGNSADAFARGAGSDSAGLTVLYIFKYPLKLDVLLLERLGCK